MPMMLGSEAVLFENFLELAQFVLPVNYLSVYAFKQFTKTYSTTEVPIN